MKKMLAMSILIFIICFIYINVNTRIVYADDSTTEGISDVFDGADGFIQKGQSDANQKLDESKLRPVSDMIYNILLSIGVCVAVIFAGILGIKFMIGSVEEKAQIKDALIPFVIGCIVIFGAFGIWKIMVTIGNQI